MGPQAPLHGSGEVNTLPPGEISTPHTSLMNSRSSVAPALRRLHPTNNQSPTPLLRRQRPHRNRRSRAVGNPGPRAIPDPQASLNLANLSHERAPGEGKTLRTVILRRFAVLVPLMLFFGAASDGQASPYEVHACRLPDGTPAPTSGWTSDGITYGAGMAASLNCLAGSMTAVSSEGNHARGSAAGFRFDAPANTTIARFRRLAHGYINGQNQSWSWAYRESVLSVGMSQPFLLGTCWNCGDFAWEGLSKPIQQGSRILLSMVCTHDWPNDCVGGLARFSIDRMTVVLDDAQPPEIIGTPGGSLLTGASPYSGVRTVEFSARDAGSGLFRAYLDVDGHQVVTQRFESNGGACAPPFTQPVPCRPSSRIVVPLDTDRLATGWHEVRLRVVDATDANTASFGPFRIETGTTPFGLGACQPSATTKVRARLRYKTVNFGASNWVSGQVSRPEGGVAGARAILTAESTPPLRLANGQVRKDGRFRFRVPPGPPRKVRVDVRLPGAVATTCGATIRFKVRTGVRFSVSPRRLQNGENITMSGLLLGSRIPSAGKAVTIQARARGRSAWTIVAALRTSSQGRFKFRYRFRRTFRRTVYEFRAVTPAGLGYSAGKSRTARAVVDP
jgi:hypothetical protein